MPTPNGTGFAELYPQILDSLKSDTLAALTNYDLKVYLDGLIKKAVAAFLFPRIDLGYDINPDDDDAFDDNYYFFNTITQKEKNVLLVFIKRFWLEQQIDDDSKMEQRYFDAALKTHSQANMIVALRQRYNDALKECEMAQYNYSRSINNTPTIGDIYNGD
jgi:hypothetical protein